MEKIELLKSMGFSDEFLSVLKKNEDSNKKFYQTEANNFNNKVSNSLDTNEFKLNKSDIQESNNFQMSIYQNKIQ